MEEAAESEALRHSAGYSFWKVSPVAPTLGSPRDPHQSRLLVVFSKQHCFLPHPLLTCYGSVCRAGHIFLIINPSACTSAGSDACGAKRRSITVTSILIAGY
jgi:hypothetical protein